ncbi:hypothetical protein N9063_00805, partial [Deltaproteobacteria bacterium]|nr:hypothetical protein [Deltaproteobacteria bacterium]
MRYLLLRTIFLCFLILTVTFIGSGDLYAGCSPYIGRATINEINVHNQSNNSGPYFVELKALDGSILAANPDLWEQWTLDICSEPGDLASSPCQRDIPAGDGLLSANWLVIDQDIIQWDYLDLNKGNKHGMEVILNDENGDIVDYLSIDSYSVDGFSGCSFPYDTTYVGGVNFNIQRQPDGMGDWDSTGGGNSGDETENDTNDPVPSDSPNLSATNASAPAGTEIVFTLTLSAASSEDVTISYATQDVTAVAGVDYTAQSGSVTIPAGDTSVTISISTALLATPNSYFYLSLSEVTTNNAVILSNLARGTILVSAVAEYRFDGCVETDTVVDSSGFDFHGTVINGPLSIEIGKVCNGAYFNGVDNYVEVDDSDLFDDSSELTILGWINPEDIYIPPSGTNARGILSKRNNAQSDVSYGVFFYSSRGDGKLYVDIDTTNNRFSSNAVIPENQWTHFAVVFDGNLPANERVRLYIDGGLDTIAT